ncbi:hypothetical protein PMAYCL1PPCAC_00030 [Pristionchus mayeri]|uniref:Uncharacterized protein n=1 Tax=Pristionchus mayeri TaxID=1317129 RepID=A0AAN4Z345_9BILA|nr:hypothetical protein PMAYCL1PPCAC_00030 [Pristionchus mayeri]
MPPTSTRRCSTQETRYYMSMPIGITRSSPRAESLPSMASANLLPTVIFRPFTPPVLTPSTDVAQYSRRELSRRSATLHSPLILRLSLSPSRSPRVEQSISPTLVRI